ncbi:hypothetical protein D3C85_1568880 [compost metagenome]
MLSKHRVEKLRGKCRCEVDAFFALPLTTTKISDHKPRFFHECVRLTELSSTSICELVVSTTSTALPRYAVGVRKG